MNRRLLQTLLLTALTTITSAQADENVLIPDVRVVLAPPQFNETFALGGIGEFGARNIRLGGTTGLYLTPTQAFKVSGEYLTQILNYEFATKHKNRWVNQFAIGGDYEYLFDEDDFVASINAGAAYIHANSKPIGSDTGRRIAGSNSGTAFIGTSLELWSCGFLSAAANYDYVQYDRRFQSGKTVQGWGGSVSFAQYIMDDISLRGTAEIRKPYNFYEGALVWTPHYWQGNMTFGFYGNYTMGKHGLPNVTTAGVIIGFAFGQCQTGCDDTKPSPCNPMPVCCISDWVMKPAVYVPIVLGIPDERAPIIPQ